MANVYFEGRVAKDIELRPANSGLNILSMVVAEKHQKKNKQTGDYEDVGTTWWDVKAFGDEAETLAETYRKGDIVQIHGRSVTREYEKNDGAKGRSLEVFDPAIRLKKRFDAGAPRQQPAGAPQGAQWGGNQQAPAQPQGWPQQGQGDTWAPRPVY